jgi:hypothetical protein
MSNDPQKDALKKAWREQERQKLIASIPIPHEELRALFDYLDRPNPPPCDHTLKETIQFLEKKKLEVPRVVDWLRENGGYCDCEVIFNVEEKFGEIVGRER